jgi:hypothetical protein
LERRLRRTLLAILTLGVGGTAADLVLLGHYENAWEVAPLGVLGLGFVAILAAWAGPEGRAVPAIRSSSALFVVTGAVGLYQHYRGNVEFELEMYPTMRGLELFWKALTGATPSLAPGSMVMLGLVGFAHGYASPRAPGRPSIEEKGS